MSFLLKISCILISWYTGEEMEVWKSKKISEKYEKLVKSGENWWKLMKIGENWVKICENWKF